jgi:hypothetical protein
VLEGLLAFERARGSARELTDARLRGQEYLLARRLFRSRETGEIIRVDRKLQQPAAWTLCSFPTRWHYDILRALDYLRSADAAPDERSAEAVGLVTTKRNEHGQWMVENPHPGVVHFELEGGIGEASRWNTLRALRVLRWARKG